MSRDGPSLPPDLLELVCAGVETYRARQRVLAAILLVLGLGVAVMLIAEGGALGAAAGLVALAPGALLFWSTTGDPRDSRIVRKLVADRERIVWIFGDPNLRLRPPRVGVGFEDRSWLSLFAAPVSAAGLDPLVARQELVRALERYAPCATVGFSLETRAIFAADPASLRRRT